MKNTKGLATMFAVPPYAMTSLRNAGVALCFTILGMSTLVYSAVVDFEDLMPTQAYPGPGGGAYWNGPDPNGLDEPDPFGGPLPVKVGAFESGDVRFVNRHNLNYGSWVGFGYSNTVDTISAGFTNQYSAFPGSGFQAGQDNYAVASGFLDALNPLDPADLNALPTLELAVSLRVHRAHVSNSTYSALSMLQGDAFAKKFGGPTGDDPDFFKLSIYATDANGMALPASVEFYLADFRFADNSLDYVLDDWMPLDLSLFAKAKKLHFNLASSDIGLFGMNTPAYFVLDNLQVATIACDLNADDLCDVSDVDLLVAELADTGNNPLFDLDGNGSNDRNDVVEWLSIAGEANLPAGRSFLFGDANLDGSVDGTDFGIWNSHKFQSTARWSRGDFNADGVTDASDFGIWNTHKFQSSDSSIIPEPSLMPLAVVFFLLWGRPRLGRTSFPLGSISGSVPGTRQFP